MGDNGSLEPCGRADARALCPPRSSPRYCLSLLALHAQPVIPRPWPQRERAARSLNGRDSRFSSTRQPFSQHKSTTATQVS